MTRTPKAFCRSMKFARFTKIKRVWIAVDTVKNEYNESINNVIAATTGQNVTALRIILITGPDATKLENHFA